MTCPKCRGQMRIIAFLEDEQVNIIRASFSQERMQYLAEPAKVVYQARGRTQEKVFDALVSNTGQALEWLVPMCSRIADRGEQMG